MRPKILLRTEPLWWVLGLTFGLSACRPLPLRPSAAAKPEFIECTVRGAQHVYPTTVFVSETMPAQSVARFYGSSSLLGITLSHIGVSRGARTRAEIRAPGSGPAFVLRGLLELRELDIYLLRDLPIVPGHAWLTRGARLELTGGGPPGTARVRASYGPFHELHVDAPCDALGLEGPSGSRSRHPTPPPAPGGSMHIARADTALRDDTGAPVLRLGSAGQGATVRLLEARGDLRRVLYEEDVRLDGYLRADELLPGEGPDCDDCHGSIRDSSDRCPDEPSADEDGCPDGPIQLARVARAVDIHLHPRPDGLVIGRIEPGVEVVVVAPKKGSAPSLFVDVRPRHGALEPVTGFFVERTALLFTQPGSSPGAN